MQIDDTTPQPSAAPAEALGTEIDVLLRTELNVISSINDLLNTLPEHRRGAILDYLWTAVAQREGRRMAAEAAPRDAKADALREPK